MLIRPLIVLILLTLAGCGASPAPAFFGAVRHDVTLSGIAFTVFQEGEKAEVIRHGYLTRAGRDRVPALMRQAVEQTTGCRIRGDLVTRLPGDTGEGQARLDCPG